MIFILINFYISPITLFYYYMRRKLLSVWLLHNIRPLLSLINFWTSKKLMRLGNEISFVTMTFLVIHIVVRLTILLLIVTSKTFYTDALDEYHLHVLTEYHSLWS